MKTTDKNMLERGASMVEYILLVALIALAVIGAVTFLSQQTDSKFNDAGTKIQTAGVDASGPCGAAGIAATATDPTTGKVWAMCNGSDVYSVLISG